MPWLTTFQGRNNLASPAAKRCLVNTESNSSASSQRTGRMVAVVRDSKSECVAGLLLRDAGIPKTVCPGDLRATCCGRKSSSPKWSA